MKNILGLLGDIPTITGSIIDNRCFKMSKVDLLAVAVKARMLTPDGTILHKDPNSANVNRKLSPLYSDNYT